MSELRIIVFVVVLVATMWVTGVVGRRHRLGAVALALASLTWLLVVATGSGVCTVFFRTAYVKLLPEVVDEPVLESANARLFGTESAMQSRTGVTVFVAPGPEVTRHTPTLPVDRA